MSAISSSVLRLLCAGAGWSGSVQGLLSEAKRVAALFAEPAPARVQVTVEAPPSTIDDEIREALKRNIRVTRDDLEEGDKILFSAPKSLYEGQWPEEPCLRANMELASKIVEHVQKLVPYSANFLSRTVTEDDLDRTGEFLDIMMRFEQLQKDCAASSTEDYAERVKAEKIGNCGGMVAVGYEDFPTSDLDQLVETVSIEGGNHCFLLIGRDPLSDAGDYKNWGPHAVICDPWAGKIYPASEIEKELHDFVTCVHTKSCLSYPVVRKFDPTKQKLTIIQSPTID